MWRQIQRKMIKEPESMENLIYMTRRKLDEKGKAMAWVYKQKCTKCGKALMGKPKDEKTGKAKIRAKEYVCPECNHTVEKKEYEETLTAEIKYTCPKCEKDQEIAIPYKRKKTKGVDALVFDCESCGEKILITKKMKKEKK